MPSAEPEDESPLAKCSYTKRSSGRGGEGGAGGQAWASMSSPIGTIFIGASGGKLTSVGFVNPDLPGEAGLEDREALARAAHQIEEYFLGKRMRFDLPMAPQGSSFQLEVWEAVSEIAFGETASYAAVAQALGRPGAARAVGRALSGNPLLLVIPCHRVLAARGAGGWAGGVDRKTWLLAHERGASSLLLVDHPAL
jgi:methylated-DNA-[protein]-cysteine S-methyltransferase